jgi:hypothetical protein
VWVQSWLGNFVVAHELAHNFGLGHSNSFVCKDSNNNVVPVSDNCLSYEYGDVFDIMGRGSGWGLHMNNYQKGRLNWFTKTNTQSVTRSNVTSDGLYTIKPIEQLSSGVQSLKLYVNDSKLFYYLEYRQPFGFDVFNTTAAVVNGVSIRLAPDYSIYSDSLLIDTSQVRTGFYDAPLLVDQTFTDIIRGVTITTVSATASEATVRVSFLPPPCVRSRPSIQVRSFSETPVLAYPGDRLEYSVTIGNNDSASCAAASFNITSQLPIGFVQEPANFSVTILPGQTVTSTIAVTSPDLVDPGYYYISETVTHGNDLTLVREYGDYYAVRQPDVTPPVVDYIWPSTDMVFDFGQPIHITALANDCGIAGYNGCGISNMTINLDGMQVRDCAQPWSYDGCFYDADSLQPGSHTVTFIATDTYIPPNSVTASSTFTVVDPNYLLNVSRSGQGTITSSPTGINCGTDCSESYTSGTSVILTATPATGYVFNRWSGGCSGTGTCTVNLIGNTFVTGVFYAASPYTLSISKTGTGFGTITSSPTGINCGTDCSENYTSNTSVILTAISATGSLFTGWSGGGCSGTSICTVTMNTNTTVTATFNTVSYTLSVSKIGTGSGIITSSPVGISCGTDCTESYTAGTSVTLTAIPASGSRFYSWSGACSGTATSCTVTMNAAKSVTANFANTTYNKIPLTN